MLSARRTAIVRTAKGTKDPRTMGLVALHKSNIEPTEIVASLEPGVVVTVQRCPAGAAECRVEVEDHQGWLKRDALWGVQPSEVID
jgi:SH3-like domain-containing protein